MALLLFIVSFLLFTIVYSKFSENKFEIFIKSFFSQILSILVISESLSFISNLNQFNIKISWLFIDFILFLISIILYKGINFRCNILFPKLNKFNVLILGIFVLLIFQGLIYPPNNYDAMTYHLARIPNWLANNSLEHYPTNIYRQLYQPPLSSLILMHINVLSNSDCFSNLLQTGFLFVAIVVMRQIGYILGVKKNNLMLLLLVTIPSVILQASSVTNNIIESVFVLIALYYALRNIQEVNLINFVFLGLASGFCLLTKGTAYLFIGPIYLMCGLHLMFKNKNILSSFKFILLSVGICLLINSFHYRRNFILTGNILGTNKIEAKKYSNEHISIVNLTSNTIKNIGINLGPYPLNKLAEKFIYKIHESLGIEINSPGTNYDDFKYNITSAPNSEDNAPNFIHLLLIVICVCVLLLSIKKRKFSGSLWFVFVIIIFQFLLFNVILKWQPWHARNQIAMFLEFVPLISLCVIDKLPKNITRSLFFILLSYSVGLIFLNRIRPLISIAPLTSSISIAKNREIKYYADRMVAAEEFKEINDIIGKEKNTTIGVNIFWNEYEYPFFRNCYKDKLKPYHIFNDGNPSKKILRELLIPNYIISTRTYLNSIDYGSFSYINITPGNSYISLYKKNK